MVATRILLPTRAAILTVGFRRGLAGDRIAGVLDGTQYISVTMYTYTHLSLEDVAEKMSRVQEIENARKEQEKLAGKKEETKVNKKMFRAG